MEAGSSRGKKRELLFDGDWIDAEAASEVFNRWFLVELSSREDVLVDQPWNQRPLCTYGRGGYNRCVLLWRPIVK